MQDGRKPRTLSRTLDLFRRSIRDVDLNHTTDPALARSETKRFDANRGVSPTLRGDLLGGVTAAIIGLPLAIAFGVATFAPLGPDYTQIGAASGVVAAIVGCVVASLFGGTPAQITGPTGPMTVVLTGFLASLVAHPPQAQSTESQVALILTLTFFTVLLGGIVQIILGFLKVGRLIHFIPYPVTAGFMNGIALIILLGQLGPFFGLQAEPSLDGLVAGDLRVHGPTVFVALVTLFAMLFWPRVSKRAPASLVGLAAGVIAYYTLLSLGFAIGPAVGEIPSVVPTPKNVPIFASVLGSDALWASLPRVVGPAITLGVLGSIDALLTSVVADCARPRPLRSGARRALRGDGR